MKNSDYCHSLNICHVGWAAWPSVQLFNGSIKNYLNTTMIAIYTALWPQVLHLWFWMFFVSMCVICEHALVFGWRGNAQKKTFAPGPITIILYCRAGTRGQLNFSCLERMQCLLFNVFFKLLLSSRSLSSRACLVLLFENLKVCRSH